MSTASASRRSQPVSAEHGRGVAELLEACREPRARAGRAETAPEGTRVAIIGRPNVGKSSLVNAVLGDERVLVHEAPGTTRDAVDTPLTFRDRRYLLIDTAGIRRKGQGDRGPREARGGDGAQEPRALRGRGARDGRLRGRDRAGRAHRGLRPRRRAARSWWRSTSGTWCRPAWCGRAEVTAQIHERLPFLDYAPICFTSAVTRLGLRDLFDQVDQVAAEARKRVQPGELLATLRAGDRAAADVGARRAAARPVGASRSRCRRRRSPSA